MHTSLRHALLGGSCALACALPAFAGTVTTDGADLVINTQGGLAIATTDDQFSFEIGGRLQADYDRFDGVYTDNGNTADAAYLRRARLEFSGHAWSVWGYKFAIDLDGDSSIKEASLSYLGFDSLTVKAGRFDPDFGLEQATSSRWTTAIERSMIQDLAPWVADRDDGLGLQLSGTRGIFYGAAGLNRASSNDDEDGLSRNNYNLRLVAAPWSLAGDVLHLGVNYAYSDAERNDGRIRTRMSLRGVSETETNGNRLELAPRDTDAFDDDRVWGLELAWAHGPLSLQGEYLRRDLSATSDDGADDRKATGYYGQIAYTLTGESRAYRLDGGKFGKIKPDNRQLGAWELFYRYDVAKVEEGDLLDNRARVQTVGVNWYANEAVKVSANYLMASTDNVSNDAGDDDGDGFSLRLQYVF